jgi:hypothetical protein
LISFLKLDRPALSMTKSTIDESSEENRPDNEALELDEASSPI